MIVHPKNILAGELFEAHHGFTVCTAARYISSYIGDDKSKYDWLKKRTKKWERKICVVTKMAGKYSQEIYAAVARTIQTEWIFFQRVMKDQVQVFEGL